MNQAPLETNPAVATGRTGCMRVFVREGRLRSGWRVAAYVVTARVADLLAALVIGSVLAVVLAIAFVQAGVEVEQFGPRIVAMLSKPIDYPAIGLGLQSVRLIVVLAVVWFFRHWIDRRSFASLGLERAHGWWREVLAGFAFSLAAWVVIFLLSLGLGSVTIAGFPPVDSGWETALVGLAVGLGLNALVGFGEEVDARGYVLQNLAEGIRFWPAVLVSAVYFGVLHLLNPGAGLGSTVGIVFAGILLASGYHATGRLWFSIGMHAAWNFAEGPVFGFPVSGLDMGGLLRLNISGPDWLMGGAFGPEAGGLVIGVEVAMIALLLAWARRNGVASKRA